MTYSIIFFLFEKLRDFYSRRHRLLSCRRCVYVPYVLDLVRKRLYDDQSSRLLVQRISIDFCNLVELTCVPRVGSFIVTDRCIDANTS